MSFSLDQIKQAEIAFHTIYQQNGNNLPQAFVESYYTLKNGGVPDDVARAILTAILQDVQEMAKGNKPWPTNDPATVPVTPPSSTKIDFAQQQFFVGCQYHWSALNPDDFFTQAKAIGATGVHCEIMELVVSGDLQLQQTNQINKLVPWAAAARKNGMILMISTNSNDSLNPTASSATMKSREDTILSVLGTDRILFQPMSEDDNKTQASVRADARQHAAAVWPKAQLADYAPANTGAAFKEYHSTNDAMNAAHSWQTLMMTDSNVTADKMSPADLIALANKHLSAGQSFVVYGFYTQPDWPTWGQIRGIKTPPPATGADAFNIAGAVGYYKGSTLPSLINMAVTGSITNAHIDAKNISYSNNPYTPTSHACLIWQEAGQTIYSFPEWMNSGATSQNWQRNMVPPPGICTEHGGKQHFPASGTRVFACIVDGASKARTNIVDAGTVP